MVTEELNNETLVNGMDERAKTCHVSLKSLTTVSVTELIEDNRKNNVGDSTANLRTSKFSTSDVSAFLNVLKSSLGSGILAMPYSFKNAGLMFGLLGTVIVGFICSHCTYILVKSSQELSFQLKKSHLNYPETSEATFEYALKGKLQNFTNFSRKLTNMCILLPNYGVGVIYILLAAATVKQVFENHTDYELNIRWYILFIMIPLLPVGTIRRMKYIAPFSGIANLFLLIGIVLVLYFTTQDMPPIGSRPLIAEYNKIPLFFCTVIFSMEGIGVILPIENSMRHPKHFLGYSGVFATAMYFVISISVVVGFTGYVKFGDDVQGSITLNLPNDILAETVKILVAIAILFTYGLQVIAAAQVIWKGVKPHISEENETFGYYTMRVIMILGHITVAIIVPNLGPVISLIGAIGLTMLGLALPALIETLTFWEGGLGFGRWMLWKNIGIGILAVFTLISGTVISTKEIIETYS